ncbi:uncharacterized protein LOC6569049 [Drosophila grimshawi]|uniref:GH22758 n=1 Tax=Drosophila grimshawi TaxID=7222 RepID=B4JWD6_DROGR|nr:uncharacterized protein LOC6569049 [Drosophila grimshawi]EDV98274.1 GH22758 [Drosophila grimshawi]
MKSTFALVLFASCLIGFLVDAYDNYVSESCITDNALTEQDIHNVMMGKLSPLYANQNVKCAARCALIKDGFMNNSGELLMDNIARHFFDAPKENIESAVAVCNNINGSDICDRAFQTLICMEKLAIQFASEL